MGGRCAVLGCCSGSGVVLDCGSVVEHRYLGCCDCSYVAGGVAGSECGSEFG